MNKLLSILLLFTFLSCSHSKKNANIFETSTKEIKTKDFTNIIDVSENSDSVKIPPILFAVNKLVSNNDLIIALERSNSDTLFRVFSTKNSEYLGGFGYTGPGPLDLEFAQISIRSVNLEGNILKVSDVKSLRTFLIDSKGIIESGKVSKENIKLVNRIPFPGAIMGMDNPTFVGDSVIYGKPDGSDKQFISYNLNDRSITDIFDFPNFREDIPASNNSTLYSKVFRYSPLHEKMVIAYRLFPVVRIYNVRNSEYMELSYEPKYDQMDIERDGNYIRTTPLFNYYGAIDITDKGIYASYDEFRWVRGEGGLEAFRGSETMELHSYDWSGNPRSKFVFPPETLRYTTTPDDSKLIFVKPEVEDYLYFYTIN